MPTPTAPPSRATSPPASTVQQPAATGAAEYNPANAPALKGARPPLPGLAEALARSADTPVQGESRRLAEAPAPKEPPKQVSLEDKPAPHVKWIAADDREVAPTKAAEAPASAEAESQGEIPAEVLKAAPRQLREALERTKAEMATIISERDMTRKEAAAFREKLATYEDRLKTLTGVEERAKELETKYLSADERLRVTDYLNHPEFHEKYVQPVAKAMEDAKGLMAELIVDPDGSPRQATMDDFAEILSAPSHTEAIRLAKERFGADMAQTVADQRRVVRAAQTARATAAKDAALKAQEWAKTQSERDAATRLQARQTFEAATKQLASKYPQLYLPKEGDADEAAARRAGEEEATPVIMGMENPVAPEVWTAKVAKVFHRAAAHPLLALRNERLSKENEALKARLAAFEKSSPDAEGRKLSDGSTAALAPDDYKGNLRAALLEASRNDKGRR